MERLANTARAKLPWHAQRYTTQPILTRGSGAAYGELDVPKTFAASTFPIKPDKLLGLAKAVLAAEFGTASGADPSALLADDFQFVAPIVGPLGRDEFLQAFGSFKVKDAFPDLQDNSWFQVDPLEPNRVWFISRASGTHTGTLNFARPIPSFLAGAHPVVEVPKSNPHCQSETTAVEVQRGHERRKALKAVWHIPDA